MAQPRSKLVLLLLFVFVCGCGPRLSMPSNGDADVESGMQLFEKRKFAEAIPLFESALDKNPRSYSKSDILTTIGNCYNELDEFEKSIEFHDRAIKEDPSNHQAYVNKGIVYRLTGDYDQAAKLYAKALDLEPDYAELHASMGALAIFQDNHQKAIEHLERAVQLDDDLAVAHSNLAIAYATVGRFTEADQELKKAVGRGYHQPQVIQNRIDQLRKVSDSANKNDK